MSIVTLRQSNFSGGEISPTFYGRSDIDKYQTGLKTCVNFIPMAYGSLRARPGFKWLRTQMSYSVAEAASASPEAILRGFKFSNDDQAVLEIGDEYIRVWQDGAVVIRTTSLSAYNPATTYAKGDFVTYGGSTYYSAASGNVGHQPNTSPVFWVQRTDCVVPTSWSTVTVRRKLRFAQSGDVVTIAEGHSAPSKLTRSGYDLWSLAAASFVPDTWNTRTSSAAVSAAVGTDTTEGTTNQKNKTWSWVATDLGAQTPIAQVSSLGESLPSAATTITCILYPERKPIVVTVNASGRLKNIYRGKNGVYGFVGQTSNTTFEDEGYAPDYSWGPPDGNNPFGSSNNYPAAVTYLDDRLCFAGTVNKPQTVWGSRVGDYFRFDKRFPQADDGAFEYTIAAREFQEIRSLVSSKALIAITSGGAWAMDGGQDPLSPLSVRVRQQSRDGASWTDPLVLGTHILYERNNGGAVIELGYNSEAEGYAPRDLTILAKHLIEGHTILDWCVTTIPQQIVWAVRDDGKILSLSYQRELNVWGWALHELGGDASAISVASVTESGRDVVYCLASLGATNHVLRCDPFETFSDETHACHLDFYSTQDQRVGVASTVPDLFGASGWTAGSTMSLRTQLVDTFAPGDVGKTVVLGAMTDTETRLLITSYTSPRIVGVTAVTDVDAAYRAGAFVGTVVFASSTFTGATLGLSYLNGQSIYVWADGELQGPFTVSGGSVTLTTPAVYMTGGFRYTPQAEVLDAEPQGTALRKKRAIRVGIEFDSDGGIWAGEASDSLHEWTPTTPGAQTGLAELRVSGRYGYGGRVWIEQRDPVPCDILAVTREIEVGG